MGTLSGILRLYEAVPTIAPVVHATETALLQGSPVWSAMDRLAQWSREGHIPSAEELAGLGVELPNFLLPPQ